MDDPVPLVAIVTLRKPCAESETTITVGISVQLGATPKPPHVPSEDRCSLQAGGNPTGQSAPSPSLQPEERRSQESGVNCLNPSEEIYIKCGIGAVGGVEYVRTHHETSFDYQITVMEGRNLTDDYTIGFCLAASKAAARAIGSSIAIEEQSGWKET